MSRLLTSLVCAWLLAPRNLTAQFQTLVTNNQRLVSTSSLQAYLVPQVARAFESSLPQERIVSTLNHEMAHTVTTDKATSSDRFFRSIFFGKVTPSPEAPVSFLYGYLTTPRWYAPRWYLEGIAVYLETWMNGGVGRAIGPYDEMVFRTLVKDSGRIYDVVGLESEGTTIDFRVGTNSYLYGTRFVSYLGLRYGNDSLLAWYNRSDDSRRYFSSQFQHVFGRSLEDER